MIITLIAAIGKNNELGSGNKLLWHLPDDFKWFIKHTIGKPVLMGRKTMDSLGKPLKGRLNVVISSKPASVPDGFVAYSSISEALKSINSHKEIAVIGGAKIYEQFMPLADRLILTRVDSRFNNADVFFPEIHPNKWNKEFSEFHPSDERHKYAFTFEMYSRT